MKYVMGIDNGGTSSKAALYDLSGHELAKCTTYTEMITPHTYWTERDMDDLKRVNLEAIKGCIGQADIDPREIAGIGCTGHGNGLYLIGRDGRPVRNGIISTDNRAHRIVKGWLSDPRYEEVVRPRTYATVWASQPPSLLRWLDENEPEVYDKTAYVLMITDLVRYWLTGEVGAERTNASGTSLYNLETRQYDEEVFRFFGIEHWLSKMPPLIESASEAGRVTKEIAEATGLREGTLVSGGMFDITAAALSTGIVEPHRLSIVTGTWSINQCIAREIKIEKELFMTSEYPLLGTHLLSEASPTSGSNLTWFVESFLKDRANIEGNVYDYCSSLVAQVPAEKNKCLFFPFIFGSNAGVEYATSGWVGVTKGMEMPDLVRAIYECVCFAHKAHVMRLAKIDPAALHAAIRIAGGITHSAVWLQMFADVFQRPLELVDVEENGALGTAITATIIAGAFSDFAEASEKMVRITKVVEPDPVLAKVYQAKYELYDKCVSHQAAVWKDIEEAPDLAAL